MTAEAFLDDFRHWPKRLFPGVQDMLALLAQRCTLACLSNTNSVHWPHVRDTLGLNGLLHRYYDWFSGGVAADPTGYKTLVRVLGHPNMEKFEKDWQQWALALEAD